MRLPQLALDHNRFVFILILLAFSIGLYSLFTMSRSEDPQLSLPSYTVSVVYSGTSPEDMEELIVDPIEETVDELGNIDEINSTITEGLAVVQIQGTFGINYDDQFDEIQSKVNKLRSQLPASIQDLKVEQFNPEEQTSIMQLALVSEDASWYSLHDTAEDLQDELEKIPGLQKVTIGAYPKEEIRVSLDLQKMAHRRVSLNQVIQSIQGENANIPGGSLKAGEKSFTIKTSGSYDNLDEIKATVISSSDQMNVHLGDIARVQFANKDQRWIGRYNGNRAIFLSITRKAGENLVTLTKNIHKELDKYQPNLPPAIQQKVAFEQAPAVSNRIGGFFINLLQGIALVGVIIFLFLGARSSYIIMIIIPIAMIITIGFLDLYGYGLQQITIASLVIALGLLVDNGIVVVENIVRFRKKGYGVLEAAAKGTSQVGYAIISSTATTVLAFAPLAFMQNGPGAFLRSLPVTVMTTLVISLVLALVLSPILSGKFLTQQKSAISTRMEHAVTYLVDHLYSPALKFSIRHGGMIISVALALFIGAGCLFPFIGVSFFPTADKPMLLIEVDAPKGVNIDRTDQAVQYAEGVLDTTAYVENYSSNTGHGNPQVYYNRVPEAFKKQHGEILVNFKEWDPARFYQTLGQFRAAFRKYPDATIAFRELKNGAPFEAPIDIRIIGDSIDSLRTLSSRVERIIQNTSGTKNIDNPLAINKTDLRVNINREKAGIQQVPIKNIDRAVRAGITGLAVDRVTMDAGDSYPVIVRLPFEGDPAIKDFNRIYVASKAGGQVPIKQLADINFEQSISQLLHYNLQRSTALTANVSTPDRTGAITQSIVRKLDQMNWPEGYSYHVAGELEAQQDSFGNLFILLGIALLGIFAVLVLQFHSFRQPLIIFSAIPLAITGSFIALFLTGWSFSFFAFVGFISLMGIVVNNSIILVDYANQLRQEGLELIDALHEACSTRFTPIALTATTTIVGLLPLTLSASELWSPLGWTIIGGMISSTFLTLFVVPVLYRWFTDDTKKQLNK